MLLKSQAVFCLILTSCIFTSFGFAADEEEPEAKHPFSFKLIDEDGKPVEDLTAKDFAITEDGVPQTISVFEYQKLTDDTPAQPLAPPNPARCAPRMKSVRPPPQAR